VLCKCVAVGDGFVCGVDRARQLLAPGGERRFQCYAIGSVQYLLACAVLRLHPRLCFGEQGRVTVGDELARNPVVKRNGVFGQQGGERVAAAIRQRQHLRGGALDGIVSTVAQKCRTPAPLLRVYSGTKPQR